MTILGVILTEMTLWASYGHDHFWSDFRGVVKVSIHSIFEHGEVETLCEYGSETFSHFLALKKFLSQKKFFIENHGHFQPKPPLQPFYSLFGALWLE